MTGRLVLILALTLSSAPLAAQDPADAAAAAPKRPLTVLPYTPGLDVKAMDRTVDPCVDLYQYSCGGWMKANPIPPDQARWDVYGKTADENQQYLWGLLEAAAKPTPGRLPAEQKTGDYFAACMDEAAVERAGAAPLKPELDAIDALASVGDIAPWLAKAHNTVSGRLMFGFGSEQDAKDSDQVIAVADAGGLGLPDRDYYFKDDAKSVETRQRYVEFVAKMLVLSGLNTDQAAQGSKAVMRIETALAKGSLTRVERRDPYKVYHKLKIGELAKMTPSFRWSDYLNGAGAPPVDKLNVSQPEFFKALEGELRKESLQDWKTYLRFHLVAERAPYLSSPFVQEQFNFYSAYLRGVKEMRPRWKRCVQWVDRDLGEALGQVFVAKTFSPEVKASALDLVQRIEAAMETRLKGLDWMSEATKKRAYEKLHTMRNKIGYPDTWRDYSSLEVKPADFIGNVERAGSFETRRQLAKIGKPVDRNEWDMTPPTVNAYYNPSMNDINFPAGVLLPPLYDSHMDDAPNYGNTGATIGHELTHGFDDEGRKFDAKGNLVDWWSKKDAAEFEKRTACIVDQYAQYKVVDDIKINSKLTLGEDLADLGGEVLAYDAWKQAIRDKPRDLYDGLSPEQRFFIGMAQWACTNERDENKRLNAMTNPHSPGEYRINGVVANMPEFAAAFACKKGQPLVRENVCRVW